MRNRIIVTLALTMAMLAIGATANATLLPDAPPPAAQHCQPGAGGICWITYKLDNVFSFKPMTPDEALTETYYSNRGQRVFTFADGAVIADAAWVAKPSETTPPTACFQPSTGIRPCRDREITTALDYWTNIQQSPGAKPLH